MDSLIVQLFIDCISSADLERIHISSHFAHFTAMLIYFEVEKNLIFYAALAQWQLG